MRLMLWSKSKALLYGENLRTLHGEVYMTDCDLKKVAFSCLKRGQTVLVLEMHTSNLLQEICCAFGIDEGRPISFYLSLTPVAIFFGHKGRSAVVVHVAAQSNARDMLERMRRGLAIARSAAMPDRVRALVPEILDAGTVAGRHVLVQSRLPGAILRFGEMNDAQLWSLLTNALQPLLALHEARAIAEAVPDRSLIFQSLPEILEHWPELKQPLVPLLMQLQSWQSRNGGEAVIVHGDYWFGNVLFDMDTLAVSGVIDWETTRDCGTPGFDALHFGLMSFAMGRDRPVAQYIVQVLTDEWDEPLLKAYVGEVRRLFGLSSEAIEHLAVLIYLNEFVKRAKLGEPLTDRARENLLTKPAGALTQWLAARVGKEERRMTLDTSQRVVTDMPSITEEIGLLPECRSLSSIADDSSVVSLDHIKQRKSA